MLGQILIGMLMIGLTVIFQAVAFHKIMKQLGRWHNPLLHRLHMEKPLILALVVLLVFAVLIVEMWAWALLYHFADIVDIPDLETALYFSTAVFTTIGTSDVSLDKGWRLLSTIEGANGFLLFGWSTAFIFEVVSQVYRKEVKEIG